MNAVGPGYLRGLSKIALHGALKLEQNLDGHAWEFNSLRRFIRYDERPRYNPVTKLPPGSFDADLRNLRIPWERGHAFLLETRGDRVFVRLQFFVSPSLPPDHVPPPWEVRLGRKPEGLADLNGLWLAKYWAERDASGHSGEIIQLR
jgi:hypothetical protein